MTEAVRPGRRRWRLLLRAEGLLPGPSPGLPVAAHLYLLRVPGTRTARSPRSSGGRRARRRGGPRIGRPSHSTDAPRQGSAHAQQHQDPPDRAPRRRVDRRAPGAGHRGVPAVGTGPAGRLLHRRGPGGADRQAAGRIPGRLSPAGRGARRRPGDRAGHRRSLENPPSQRVLRRNGFSPYGVAHSSILLDGSWRDGLLWSGFSATSGLSHAVDPT